MKAKFPMVFTVGGIVTLLSERQVSNALLPILTIPTGSSTFRETRAAGKQVVPKNGDALGTVTLVRPLQYANVCMPRLVTEAGIETLVSPVQLKNAPSPMLVTEAGIETPLSPVQPANAWTPMPVTGLPSISAGTSTTPVAVSG